MNTICKEIHAERAFARSNASTQQIVLQAIEASTEFHGGRRFFAPVQRCDGLKGYSLPAQPRLAPRQNPAARRGKNQEVRT